MTIKEKLKKNEKMSNYLFFFFLFVAVGSIVAYVPMTNDIRELELQLLECKLEILQPEVINGNLYIGYEDGVRIGYHQNYVNKNIWYRCAKECKIIE